MKTCTIFLLFIIGLALPQPRQQWQRHDRSRPQPTVINPDAKPLPAEAFAPSDAILLFDGTDFSQWQSVDGGEVDWKLQDGYMEVVKGTGSIQTIKSFGNCQLHIEWATPEKIAGKGQGRGNSGVFFMSHYEVQVLDSHNNKTYPDGQAAAIYGQYPPMVNASRPAGEWQTYDIVFYRPVFGKNGTLIRPGALTVFHNGVLVQHNARLVGSTVSGKFKVHGPRGPLMLQDHSNPVRYRNIWIREISDRKELFAPLIFPSDAIVDDANPLTIEMKSVPGEMQIRYTLDGSEPTRYSMPYDDPFMIEKTTLIKARGFTQNYDSSLVSVSNVQYVDPRYNGLDYWTYSGDWKVLPDFTTLTHEKQGVVYTPTLERIDTPAGNYAVLYKGFLNIIKAGEYTLYLRSNDGSRLSLADQVVVNNDGVHGTEQKLGTIQLDAGFSPFELAYFQSSGGASLQVYIQGPDMIKQPLPANLLYRRVPEE